MKRILLFCALVGGFALAGCGTGWAAEDSVRPRLDVLQMEEIPPGHYDVSMQLGGETHTVRLAIRNGLAAFVGSSTPQLEGLSGPFRLIGNGVFLARLAGRHHRASQWWIFQEDGTATVKEIPDRGEEQVAEPAGDGALPGAQGGAGTVSARSNR